MIDDLEELVLSPGVTDPSLTTRVYHDGRNIDGSEQSQTTPIEGIWTADGSSLVSDTTDTKFEGSRYFHYDHALGKMVVETELEGEQNSDDPQVSQKTKILADPILYGSLAWSLRFVLLTESNPIRSCLTFSSMP